MATAHARRLYEHARRPVRIVDRRGAPRWHDIWLNNPCIAPPGYAGPAVEHRNGGHCRPYIEAQDRTRYVFRPGTLPGPGEIHFDAWEAKKIANRRERWKPFVVVEPSLKPKASSNKAWGWERYEALVRLLPDLHWVQLGPAGIPLLPGVAQIETPSFREACAALACAAAYVGAEGGLHHAAAALAIPAVVIFGGFIAPSVTGYARPRGAEHRNLYVENARHPHGCGTRVPCGHCRDAMASISPERVAAELRDVLQTRAAPAA